MSHSEQGHKSLQTTDDAAQRRIDELEVKLAFMEETVDTLNSQMAELPQQFDLARQAMRMMNKKLEQLQADDGQVKDSSQEAPPPHY